jgi:hypothetical protein
VALQARPVYGMTLGALVITNDPNAKRTQASGHHTVRQAVEAWLEHGLVGRHPSTVTNRTILARTASAASLGLSSPHGTDCRCGRSLAGREERPAEHGHAGALAALQLGRPDRGHCAPHGPCRYERSREGLPQGARLRRGVRQPLWMPFHDPRAGRSDWQLTGKAPMWRNTGSRRKGHLTRGTAGGRYWI